MAWNNAVVAELNATLEPAREAAGRYAWAEGFELFGSADAAEPLGPDDLDRMAECAWWIGKMRHCIALRERAHTAYLKASDKRRAARVAIDLGNHHSDLLEPSVASAWIQLASRLLDGEPEGSEHAWLKLGLALEAQQRGDIEACANLAGEASEMAAAHGDKDLFALGLALKGTCFVMPDDVAYGTTLLEEATVAAVSGELGPEATGWIYCMMITVSSELADWQRAGQWTEAAKRWCDRQAINGFPGVCRVHRAEIMRLRGALSEAEEEARTATDELGSFNLYFTALAFKELGEVRLRMGEVDAAEEAFRQANEMGVTPQPGLALVQLHRGKPEAAASALKRALADEGTPPLGRVKLLPAQLDVAIELGDLVTARAAAAEIATIASSYTSPGLRATAEASAATVHLAAGELEEAERAAKRARQLCTESDLIYEAARVCRLLGEIYREQGDTEAARFEISSALSAFERIGAMPDADRARSLLATISTPQEPTRVARTFLFSDIVRSTNLLDAIGDDAWGDLLKWHDTALRRLFDEHRAQDAEHTGDGFFVAFPDADAAVACAIAIQRSLVEHRRAHGFAPQVRIGIHATEASEERGKYHGKGVHEAARIGTLAGADEILVSASTLECLTRVVRTSDERTATLKGVAEPVRLASVIWRDAVTAPEL